MMKKLSKEEFISMYYKDLIKKNRKKQKTIDGYIAGKVVDYRIKKHISS